MFALPHLAFAVVDAEVKEEEENVAVKVGEERVAGKEVVGRGDTVHYRKLKRHHLVIDFHTHPTVQSPPFTCYSCDQ